MASEHRNSYSIFTVMFIVFVVLKLCGCVDWSWWWITSPIWGSVGMYSCLVTAAKIVRNE